MRLTAIDIGTNTILMLIGDPQQDGTIRTVRDEIRFPRLGKGVDESRIIRPDTFERALEVLKDYKRISKESGSERIIACGTSALRDSHNQRDLIQRIKRELDIDVEVLTGEEEARWTYFGAVSDFRDPAKPTVVIDIGGGSTEITLGKDRKLEKRVSLNLGCVRLTERFLHSLPAAEEDVAQARGFIRDVFTELGDLESDGYTLVGVAGTATTLAALDLDLKEFDAEKVNGHVVSVEGIKKILDRLRHQPLEQIRSSPVIPVGRADVLLAGVLILIEFVSLYHFDQLTVSSRGLRYGLILREYQRLEKPLQVRCKELR